MSRDRFQNLPAAPSRPTWAEGYLASDEEIAKAQRAHDIVRFFLASVLSKQEVEYQAGYAARRVLDRIAKKFCDNKEIA